MKDDDKEKDKSQEANDKPWWSEMMREVTTTGLATFFMTEDSVRSYLKDKKMPKELVSLFLEGVTRKKDDLYALMAKEFGKVLSKIDVSREVGRFLEKHKIHFEAKISFEPKRPGESGANETKITIQDKGEG